jgi:trans-aconitate methyltransferase
VTDEELADLEDEWAHATGQGVPEGAIGFLPYPIPQFTHLLRMTSWMIPATEKNTFIDLGAGIGTKVKIAARMGYGAIGIDIIPAYIAKAREIGAPVTFCDVRKAPVAGFHVVYLNHPLADPHEENALEARILAELTPYAVLINVHSPNPRPAGRHWRTLATTSDGTGYAVQKEN